MGEDQIPKDIVIVRIMMEKIRCKFEEKLSKNIYLAAQKTIELTFNGLINKHISI